MTTDRQIHLVRDPATCDTPEPRPGMIRVLAVALMEVELMHLPRHILAPDASVQRAGLWQVPGAPMSGPDAPDLILSPLTCHGFDCMDLLTLLRESGFDGRYLVLARGLPDIALIRAEMQAIAGPLDVDIIPLGARSVLHAV